MVFRREKTVSELEEENERLSLEEEKANHEFSIAQKRAMASQLKDRGLTPKQVGDTGNGISWRKIYNWLKTH